MIRSNFAADLIRVEPEQVVLLIRHFVLVSLRLPVALVPRKASGVPGQLPPMP